MYKSLQSLKDHHPTTEFSPSHLQSRLDSERERVTQRYDWQRYGRVRRVIHAGLILSSVQNAVIATARLDPSGIGAVAIPAVTSLLGIALNKVNLDQVLYIDLHDICSKLQQCHDKELKILKYRRPDSANLYENAENALIELYALILEYVVKLGRYLEMGSIRSIMVSTFTISEMSALKKDIDAKHKAAETQFELIKSDKELTEANRKILSWITNEDMAEVHRRFQNQSRIDGKYGFCGQWLLSSTGYTEWDQAQGKKVFWLVGTAGTGKTTLCGRVIDDLQKYSAQRQDHSAAYIYCSGTGVSNVTNCKSVLDSIIRQLAVVEGRSQLVRPVARFYTQHSDRRPSGAHLTEKEQKKLLSDIFAYGIDTHITIDALDECRESGNLLRILREATDEHPKTLKIFLTSRQGTRVDECFPEKTMQFLAKDLTISDMKDYIYTEIGDRRHLLPDEKQSECERKLHTALFEQASGM